MARSYYIGNSAAVTASVQLTTYAASALNLRPRIYEFALSAVATPADNATKINLIRHGTAGPTGGTAPTVGVVEVADPAQLMSAYQAATGGTTLGLVLMMVSFNQRATFRWCAVPGKEFVIPAATQWQGIGLQSISQSGAHAIDTSLYWEE